MNETINSIAFIGAGNVATHLAQAFAGKGFNIRQVFSRTEASARELADKLACPYTDSLEQLTPDADLYVVSIKDSALEAVIPQITCRNPQALFVHTAGSMPADIWRNHAARYGVIYPMQTFSKQREVDFVNIPVFIEANTPADTDRLMRLMKHLSQRVYQASSEQRRYLHIAAVFACNFTNHMYAVCEHLLKAHGLPFTAMLPLIDETARKVHVLSPTEAQTGPACRYDTNVIDRHLQMLSGEPELAKIYELISRNIHLYNTTQNKD